MKQNRIGCKSELKQSLTHSRQRVERSNVTSRKSGLIAVGCVSFAFVCFAEMGSDDTNLPGHAPMEVFGIGPEMFGDRGSAWIKNAGRVSRDAVSEFGLVVLAVIALKKNISNAELKERVERVDERAKDNQAQIAQVALAVPAPGTQTVKIEQPQNEPIPVSEVTNKDS